MPWVPRHKFIEWPVDAVNLELQQVIDLYESGHAGAKYDPDAESEFYATMPEPDGENVVHRYGMADSGAGKLVIPFVHVLEMFPGCWPGRQGQGRGDCVSWSTRNGCVMTMVGDIIAGQPDEKSGKVEAKPDVPAAGVADGVLSTESIYWYRGYNGDGWHCPTAAMVACTKSGLFLRKDYPELGVNLTSYSSRTAGKYGRTPPPEAIRSATAEHLIHQATEARSGETIRDLLYSCYGISSCGGEGWSSTRDKYGASVRRGGWSHALAFIGYDDRGVIKQIFGEPMVLILNSWALWNSGPRDIFESAALVPPEKKEEWIKKGIVNPATGNIMIPEGSFWTKLSTIRNRSAHAFAGAAGWAARFLSHYA